MRIALFAETFLPHTDGVVTRLINTVDQLVQAGDSVLVVAPAAHGLPENYGGTQVIGTRSFRLPMYPDMRIGLPILSQRLRSALGRFAPQLIHTANPVVLGLGALYFAHRWRLPLVASFHTQLAAYARRYHLGLLEEPAWIYLRALHNCATLNLCTSRPMKVELVDRGFHRLAIWEPGVDTQRFHPQRRTMEWRHRLTDGHPDATIILSVGRLAAEKQLEKLAPVLAGLNGCHLSFVGSGPAEMQLRRVFANLPATFVGPLHGFDLAGAYASADIFALPSSTETLGLVALEAMAAGLPVIGAGRGGIPDLVVEGETGFLFDPDHLDTLTFKLNTLVADMQLRLRLGHAGRQRAEGWSWERTTAGLRAHYAKAVAGNQVV